MELSGLNGCKKMQAKQREISPLQIDRPRPRLEKVESDGWGPRNLPKSDRNRMIRTIICPFSAIMSVSSLHEHDAAGSELARLSILTLFWRED